MMETKDAYVYGEKKVIEKDIEEAMGLPVDGGLFSIVNRLLRGERRDHTGPKRSAQNLGYRANLRPLGMIQRVPYTGMNRQQRRAVARDARLV